MKNFFGICGVLILLKSLEGMMLFYQLIFTNRDALEIWAITEGVIGTAIAGYLLFSITRWIIKVVVFWNSSDPNAEIER